ncbi:MAG: UDP-N-acetylglucosamine 4,6-dehydratase (inverting) [Chlorobi bacterium]|nr:UDP-N-acetylglucosamine 4,6-dehydratase (inverting) [Chlorobiota bacterium]
MLDFKNKSILITGGTGSFGKKFVKTLLDKFPDIERLVIYSRDELKQFEMAQDFPKSKFRGIRYFIGDIRDKERFNRACEGIDYIVHAAALKQVPAAEYNPMEFIKTNILGAESIIEAALNNQVKKVVALSTDKAAAPINLYGATKLVSDKLFIAANNMKGKRDISFSAVRYGNVLGSRGSVIPFFMKIRKSKKLPITDLRMTRFNITLDEAVKLVMFALEKAIGSELFVPKIPSYKITEVAEAVCPDCELEDIGIRPGEKLHEEMITVSDSFNTLETKDYYIILPPFDAEKKKKYAEYYQAEEVEPGFVYNSYNNKEWITAEDIREQIKKYVDPNFKI